jgi:hypothetical protein
MVCNSSLCCEFVCARVIVSIESYEKYTSIISSWSSPINIRSRVDLKKLNGLQIIVSEGWHTSKRKVHGPLKFIMYNSYLSPKRILSLRIISKSAAKCLTLIIATTRSSQDKSLEQRSILWAPVSNACALPVIATKSTLIQVQLLHTRPVSQALVAAQLPEQRIMRVFNWEWCVALNACLHQAKRIVCQPSGMSNKRVTYQINSHGQGKRR